MKLNLKHWKKIQELKDHVVMRNPEGHELKIDKKKLSPKLRDSLSQIRMAEGGQVKKPEETKPQGQWIANGSDPEKRKKAAASLASAFGMAEGGEVDPLHQGLDYLMKIPAIQKALDFGGNLDESHRVLKLAMSGDPEAQQMVAEKSLGTAMGTVQGPKEAGFLDKPKVTEFVMNQEGLNQKDLAKAVSQNNAQIDKMAKLKAQKQAPRQYADGGDVSAGQSDENNPQGNQPAININIGGQPQMQAQMPTPEQFNAQPNVNQVMTPSAAPPNQSAPFGTVPDTLYGTNQPMSSAPQESPSPETAQQQPMPEPQAMQSPPEAQSVTPPISAQPQIAGPQDNPNLIERANTKVLTGLEQAANTDSAEAKQLADIYHKQVNLEQQASQHFQTNMADIQNEVKTILGEYKSAKIDPNHFIDQMNPLSRITTAIGLIAGGIGGGLTHQENPAMKFLNSQIERDVQAQKDNIDRKGTVINALYQQMGNARAAADMYRMVQTGILNDKIKEQAAKAADPQAQARLLQASGQMEAQMATYQQQAAVQKTIDTMMHQVAGTPDQSQMLVDLIQKVDPKRASALQERLVPGMGFANTSKDASSLKELKATVDGAQIGIQDLLAISKKPFKSWDPIERARAQSIAGTLKGGLKTAIVGSGAVSESEWKILDNLIPDPTKLNTLDASNQAKLSELSRHLNNTLARSAEARGARAPDPTAKLDAKQRMYLDWAKNNPGDPKAQAVFKTFENMGINIR